MLLVWTRTRVHPLVAVPIIERVRVLILMIVNELGHPIILCLPLTKKQLSLLKEGLWSENFFVISKSLGKCVKMFRTLLSLARKYQDIAHTYVL